ncbi:MAG: hypothetical protein IKR29_05625 [Bacteroidales bacterium]|nr:hypothetical protein [Bacteroidales bacterium]
MSEESNVSIRLSKAAKEFNVGRETIVEFLTKKGFQVDPSPNTKLTPEMVQLLVKEYQSERDVKNEAKKLGDLSYKGGSVSVDSAVQSLTNKQEEEDTDEVFIRTSTLSHKQTPAPEKREEKPAKAQEPAKPVETTPEPETQAEEDSNSPIKVLGKIDLDSLNAKTRPDKKSKEEKQREAKEKAERQKRKNWPKPKKRKKHA